MIKVKKHCLYFQTLSYINNHSQIKFYKIMKKTHTFLAIQKQSIAKLTPTFSNTFNIRFANQGTTSSFTCTTF